MDTTNSTTPAPDFNSSATSELNNEVQTAGLLIQAGDNNLDLMPENLYDEEFAQQLRSIIDEADCVHVQICNVLFWSIQDRVACLRLLQQLESEHPGKVKFFVEDGTDECGLFDTVNQMLKNNINPADLNIAFETAIIAATIIYPTCLKIACNQIDARLKVIRIKGFGIREIVKRAEAFARQHVLPVLSDDNPNSNIIIRDKIGRASCRERV